MDPTRRGRSELEAFFEDQPCDLYAADTLLQALHARDWTEAERERHLPAIRRFAREVPRLDALGGGDTREGRLPRLDGWTPAGTPTRPLVHHPDHDAAGRVIYGSGMMALYAEDPPPHRAILSLFYLSSHAGEAGHNCPVACTAGAIRVLRMAATEEQRERWLGRLLDPDWDRNHTGAQFLTEVQGGSDVGANGLRALPDPEGGWRLHGEKWFCSNAGGDVVLLTARPEGAEGGTRGLGLFLMPAVLPDGRPNAYRIRRLKDKIGTRNMATAEIDLQGAWAELVTPPPRGFRTMMELVIDTSRLYNAFGCAGLAHRACLVAATYARHRTAFGRPIADYPLVQADLAASLAHAEGALAGSWVLAGLQERIDAGEADDTERAFFRIALNLNKYRTAEQARNACHRCIGVLAGNGTVETFTVLPRLLRDAVVYENWEGATNTLRMQVVRDSLQRGLHEGFFAWLEDRLGPERVGPVRRDFEALLAHPPEIAGLGLREVGDRMATLVQLAGLEGIDHPGVRARAGLLERELAGPVPADLPARARLLAEAWRP